jgi:hypothetical protein
MLSDPEGSVRSFPFIVAYTFAFWCFETISYPSIVLTELNRFNLSAYGL